jgi:hypothetical protein
MYFTPRARLRASMMPWWVVLVPVTRIVRSEPFEFVALKGIKREETV